MINKLSGWDDTIVALATAPGISAIGVIRLSGKKAFDIIDGLFPSKKLSEQLSHTLHVGYLKEDNKVLDEVVVSLFKAPGSYTGEDVVEISCHGSSFVLNEVINACVKKGARLARAGEFTQRAFLNGKLDLAQAEAVADLIASNTSASHRTALHTIRGGFSDKLKMLRERMIRFSALIELELDFSQEDVEFADRKQLYSLIEDMQQAVQQLASSFQLGNVIKKGVNAAIIGKPNTGKSTLLNTLLNENRAIVSDIPGTTRDTIEEVINIDGILFRLTDTAGIRQHASDVIEAEGVERSIKKMKQADLVIYLIDNNEKRQEIEKRKSEMDLQQLKYLLVVNKIDEEGEAASKEKFSYLDNAVFISAKEQWHTDVLRERMVDTVLQGTVQTEDTIITNARHYHALKEVETSLADIKNGMDKKITGDLLALDIRRCLYYLGEITGEVTNEDQLDYIFSKFCIGK